MDSKKRYNLSIGAIFKNEEQSIKEWIEHYLFHGVEHFFLINDGSTDSFMDKLQSYIDKNVVSLYDSSTTNAYLGRQRDIYNMHLLPQLKKTQWLLIADLDEYIWSPMYINLNDLLKQCLHLGQIQVRGTLFGSNGHIHQPSNIVQNFTKCGKKKDGLKYIINSNFLFSSLNVHHASFINIQDEKDKFIILEEPYLAMNHYSCQSQEFWEKIKMTRGDADNYLVRTKDDFYRLDKNEIEDFRLAEQNKDLIF